MAYNPNIPQPNDIISQSQDQILQNFQALDGADNGEFPYILLDQQTSNPGTSATQRAIYSKALLGSPQVYLQKASNGIAIPMTAQTNNWTMLPSGILMKWGTAGTPGGGQLTVTFPVSSNDIPFSTCYSVLLTTETTGAAVDPNKMIYLYQFTALNFIVYGTNRTTTGGANVSFRWLAIGLANL